MKNFEFERWDHGRLVVNCASADILRSSGFTTFDSLMHFEGGTVAKNLLRQRTTTRIELPNRESREAFYIKRHGPSPWKEYLKPLLRMTRPILGARHEWEAMIRFHKLGIPTMIPVALGESRRDSFVVTKSIEGCSKLSHWMQTYWQRTERADIHKTRQLIEDVARIARTMHSAGLHHQDFYLTHLLMPQGDAQPGLHNDQPGIYVIDLGRVCCRKRLAWRWIVKDLAQLNYSADLVTHSDRQRFLKAYLGRPLRSEDRKFVRRILRKSEAIARHSRKHRL